MISIITGARIDNDKQLCPPAKILKKDVKLTERTNFNAGVAAAIELGLVAKICGDVQLIRESIYVLKVMELTDAAH